MTQLRTVRSLSLPPKAEMRVANIFVRLLLRSPLHRPLSAYLLLLTYTRRRSRKRYSIPCGYWREGRTVILVAGNPWWKNLQGGASVELHIAGEDLSGFAAPVEAKVSAAKPLRCCTLTNASGLVCSRLTLYQHNRQLRATT
jgi:hypothetical protein